MTGERHGAVEIATESGAESGSRRAGEKGDRDHVVVRSQTANEARLTQDGPSAVLSPASLAICDTAWPFEQILSAGQRAYVLTMPRALRLDDSSLRGRESGRAVLASVMASIDDRLGDPDLSPRSIAEQHHVSVRYLHLLFQRQGTTVNGWIRSRRLEAARRDLALCGPRRRSVAAVGARWGFLNPSHFSRAFKAAYGMSPTRWRDHARSAERPAGSAVH